MFLALGKDNGSLKLRAGEDPPNGSFFFRESVHCPGSESDVGQIQPDNRIGI